MYISKIINKKIKKRKKIYNKYNFLLIKKNNSYYFLENKIVDSNKRSFDGIHIWLNKHKSEYKFSKKIISNKELKKITIIFSINDSFFFKCNFK